ncbi:MAG: aminodeoxychorismate/anthranilate synthase component II [Crocinitomicaceae bacterium]|nr:aminodeoxychorismate/anthranilate synthase component II [Crocinitomicaceae bacterium]MBK8924662.1 aminodeoxychorismate/anthranilate synthase component II [Crocinitomicaceae bacterium]
MKLLVLDNYDSFTYNLVHLVEQVGDIDFDVKRNDKITLNDVEKYDKIILSPGPGLPVDAGIMPELIARFASSKSILGVCLGLQAIGEAFGAKLKNLETVHHGVSTAIYLREQDTLFAECPEEFQVGRYHSWVIDSASLSDQLLVTAVDSSNEIMAVRHKHYDVKGVQFHPESILSEHGQTMMYNWLNA